jgi:ATP synthase, F1 gamma subunit
MGQSLARIKRRINTVQSTRKITNSMKLISSVKLRKINKIVELEGFYFSAMKRILSDAIFYNKENVDNNYKTEFIKSYPEAKKKLYILVTSNMGLCGGYNNNIIRLLKNIYVAGDEIMVIGEKGYLALTKEEDIKLDTSFLHILSGYSLTKVSGLTNHVMKRYLTKEYKEIDLVYTRYKNSIAFIPEVKKILPIEVHENKNAAYSPIYEPSKDAVVDEVIKQYLKSLLYNLIYNAIQSEESSRRNTMDAADKNAQDLVDDLKLEYNKARQGAITQEITEVVNGSNAVK